MTGKIYLSTAYLPPVEYFARMREAEGVLIEKEENYRKQTYRNRCYILSASGIQYLTVPVLLGSFHKTPVKDIRIDYSKRWRQIHLRAMTSSYGSSPYFIYYFEKIEKIILHDHEFLLDLNMDLLIAVQEMLGSAKEIMYTTEFLPVEEKSNDYRYKILPGKISGFTSGRYTQVFESAGGFVNGLSIIDLVFNTGPDAASYL